MFLKLIHVQVNTYHVYSYTHMRWKSSDFHFFLDFFIIREYNQPYHNICIKSKFLDIFMSMFQNKNVKLKRVPHEKGEYMNYKQFVSAIEKKVKQSVNEGMSVCVHTTVKNNGRERVGITVMEQGINISPTIYLEEFYEQFQKDESLEGIVKNILDLYQEVKVEQSWEPETVKNYECARSKIIYKVINAEDNIRIIRDVPHVSFLDLEIIFCMLVDANNTGTATILVTNEIMKVWGVGCEALYREAMKNTKKLLPAEFHTMKSVIAELLGEKLVENVEEDCMYVLTNDIRSFGAACILYEGLLERIGDELEENYYVLPSSIHEVIIIPESKSPNRVELDEMIEEINETQVQEEEVLSNRAYYFSRKENRLIL